MLSCVCFNVYFNSRSVYQQNDPHDIIKSPFDVNVQLVRGRRQYDRCLRLLSRNFIFISLWRPHEISSPRLLCEVSNLRSKTFRLLNKLQGIWKSLLSFHVWHNLWSPPTLEEIEEKKKSANKKRKKEKLLRGSSLTIFLNISFSFKWATDWNTSGIAINDTRKISLEIYSQKDSRKESTGKVVTINLAHSGGKLFPWDFRFSAHS